jgi:hypothetical protein
MKHDDQNQLLNEVLGGQHLEGFRQTTLENGLRALRQRRRRRRMTQVCAVACLPLLAAALLLSLRGISPVKRIAMTPVSRQQTVPTPNPKIAVKIISDEELFALFPNRSMALVGKPGHQQLVFLIPIPETQ